MPSFAHSGSLNSHGCHNNLKTGDYHRHRSAGVVWID
ncbi:YHYH domain-containing protein [Sphingorhabdus sp.]